MRPFCWRASCEMKFEINAAESVILEMNNDCKRVKADGL